MKSAIQSTVQPIAEFLANLRNQDIHLYIKDNRLRCNAPKGGLTPSLRQQITERKAELIEFMQQFGGKIPSNTSNLDDIYRDLPLIAPNQADRYQSFPLTEIQQAYLIGRDNSFDLSNVSTHVYSEIDVVDLDLKKFERAWQYLIQKHEMMRAVVNVEGHQQILEQVPDYHIEALDARTEEPEVANDKLMALRDRLSHQLLPTDTWPLFELKAALLDDSTTRLFISIDLLIADAWSLELIVRDLMDYLHNPQLKPVATELSFRDYVLAEIDLQKSAVYQRSQTYWQNRVATLPPSPELPIGTNPASIERPRFVHHTFRLSPERWQQLRRWGLKANITPSAIILAAFSEVLAAWSKQPRFTLNVTLFRRLPLHEEVNRLVGDFTSLDLLAIDNSGLENFVTRAQNIQKQLWQDLDHRYVSGMKVLRDIAHAQQRYSGALMPIVYTSTLTNDSLNRDRFANNSSTESASVYELGELVYSLSQTPQIYLDHQVLEEKGALILNWDAIDEVFPPGMLDDMFQAYGEFIEALATQEAIWQADPRQIMQQLFPPRQVAQLKKINDTDQQFLRTQPNVLHTSNLQTGHTQTFDFQDFLHGLFFERLKTSGAEAAVIADDFTLTYRELGDRAQRLGDQLRHLGASPNQLVAVVMKKGWEQVVAVLGILVSGAAYVPIDPDWPQARRQQLLEQGSVNLVLTQPELDRNLAWPDDVHRVSIDRDETHQSSSAHSSSSNTESARFQPLQTPNDLAYVIYTSGSTGVPKGVAIEHRAVVNTILDINHRFQVGSQDRVLAISSLSFDLSVYDIFGTLAAGGTLVIPNAIDSEEPAHWANLITQHHITLWNSVPALMQMLVEYKAFHPEISLNTLRLVLLSGDWIPLNLPDQIKALSPQTQVVSLGGATEVSIWSILYPIEQVDPSWKSIPYGTPMANQQFHILNEQLAPCPVWVPGGLYISGTGLAREYWRNPDKTHQSFIHHPVTGERLYRTGDLGYYRPDGVIMFLGRADSQVKVQGYRIELGEIETALEQLSVIKQAVVLLKGEAQETKRLVAYVVLEEVALEKAATPTTPESLKRELQRLLPDYMVPSAFVFLDNLPLTVNGKVDRKGLPEPPSVGDRSSSVLGSTASVDAVLVQQISQLIARVLKVDAVDPNANLLDLGANSIDMTRIANLMEQQLQHRLPIRDLYSLASVNAIANHITGNDNDDASVAVTATTQELLAEAVLEISIAADLPTLKPSEEPSEIFLTGATGFLGSYLLHELLSQTQANIHCLVRASDVKAGKKRLQNKLDSYGLWRQDLEARIVPVPGDLSKPYLGLSDAQFHQLTASIDVIYHNGAIINFVHPYTALKPPNVLGTHEILNLASRHKIKPVHYVSTVGVFPSANETVGRTIYEKDSIDHGEILYGGYAQSKWVAEKIVELAGQQGLPVFIYRPGIITGHTETGVSVTQDFLSLLLKSCIQLGLIPDLDTAIQMTPVDYVSRGIIYLSRQQQLTDKNFHLVNPNPCHLTQLREFLQSFGYNIEQTSIEQWKNQAQESAIKPLLYLLQPGGARTEWIKFDSQNATQALSKDGIICPSSPDQILSAPLSYFIQNDFLSAPVG